jgi:hypothetical protein
MAAGRGIRFRQCARCGGRRHRLSGNGRQDEGRGALLEVDVSAPRLAATVRPSTAHAGLDDVSVHPGDPGLQFLPLPIALLQLSLHLLEALVLLSARLLTEKNQTTVGNSDNTKLQLRKPVLFYIVATADQEPTANWKSARHYKD